MMYQVSEIFSSIQGEGVNSGIPSVFIRFAGCNLSCRWCDTPYTWNWEGTEYEHVDGKKFCLVDESKKLSSTQIIGEVFRLIDSQVLQGITITGGEPMIYGDKLIPILEAFSDARYCEIETNGTFLPSPRLVSLVDYFNVSVKLASSGVSQKLRLKDEPLSFFAKSTKAWFKFVICDPEQDIYEINGLMGAYHISIERILLMPEGRTVTDLRGKSLQVSELCKDYGFRYCPRIQIDLYGDRRGV